MFEFPEGAMSERARKGDVYQPQWGHMIHQKYKKGNIEWDDMNIDRCSNNMTYYVYVCVCLKMGASKRTAIVRDTL